MMPSPGALLHQINHHWCRKHNPIDDPPTVIFEDGFESGDFSAWTGIYESGATVSVQGTTIHHGSYGMQVAGLRTSGERAWSRKAITGYSALYARVYYNFGSPLPEASTSWWSTSPFFAEIVEVNHIAFPIFSFDNNQWGIRYRDTAGTWLNIWETGTSSVSANTWYSLEIYLSVGANATVTLWVDGVEKVSGTGLDIQRTIANVEVGNPWVEVLESADRTIFVDCVVVADTYIGPEVPPPVAGAKALIGGLYLVYPA